jgi:hypothetical protein
MDGARRSGADRERTRGKSDNIGFFDVAGRLPAPAVERQGDLVFPSGIVQR